MIVWVWVGYWVKALLLKNFGLVQFLNLVVLVVVVVA